MRPRNPTVRFALFGRGTDAPTAPAQTKPAGHRVRSGSTFRRCAGPRHSPPTALPDRPPAAGKRRAACRRTTGSCRRRECALPPAPRRSARLCGQGSISERLLVTTSNLFPTNPTAKASVAPKTDAHPMQTKLQKTERGTERPSVSLRTTFFVAASSPAQPPSGIHIYRTAFGQAGTKNLRRRTKPAQEHAPYPPTDGIPKQCSEKPKHAATKSKKDSRTKLRIPTYRTSLPQTDIRILPQPFFSRKKGISYTSAPCPQCCDRTQNGKGSRLSAAPLSAALRHPSPPVFTRARPHSPVLRRYLPKNETTQGARSGTTPHTAVKHP